MEIEEKNSCWHCFCFPKHICCQKKKIPNQLFVIIFFCNRATFPHRPRESLSPVCCIVFFKLMNLKDISNCRHRHWSYVIYAPLWPSVSLPLVHFYAHSVSFLSMVWWTFCTFLCLPYLLSASHSLLCHVCSFLSLREILFRWFRAVSRER